MLRETRETDIDKILDAQPIDTQAITQVTTQATIQDIDTQRTLDLIPLGQGGNFRAMVTDTAIGEELTGMEMDVGTGILTSHAEDKESTTRLLTKFGLTQTDDLPGTYRDQIEGAGVGGIKDEWTTSIFSSVEKGTYYLIWHRRQ